MCIKVRYTARMFNYFYQRVLRLSYWQLFVFALLCFMPALFSPFYSDDFFHLLLIEAAFNESVFSGKTGSALIQRAMPGSILGLFAFVDDVPAHLAQLRQFSIVPWWTLDDFHFRFWRPVAELSHIFDYVIWPRSAFFSHAHNIILFFISAALLVKLTKVLALRSGFSVQYVQSFSFLVCCIYLLDGQHVATVSWVANRNALIAAIFSLWAMLQFIQWHDSMVEGKRLLAIKALGLSTCLWLLALLSGEAALAMSAYFFAFVVVYSELPLKQRIIILLPFLLLSLVWLFVHQSLGYGAEPSGNSYVNPIAHPFRFMQLMFERLPVYWFANVSSTPAGAYWTIGHVLDGFEAIYWCVAVSFTLSLLYLARRFIAESKLMQFALLAFFFAGIPAALANPQDRLALFLSFASALFFAALLFSLAEKLSDTRSWWLSFSFSSLVVLQLVISPVHLLLGGLYMRYEAKMINAELVRFDEMESVDGRRLVFFDLPLGYNVMMTGVRAYYEKPLPLSSFYLSNDTGQLVFSQPLLNDDAIHVERSPAFATGFDRYFRDVEENPFEVGDHYAQAGIEVQVLTIDDNHNPTKIKLSLQDDLEAYQFYRWRQGEIQRVLVSDVIE